jgi:hypothetical protein
MQQAFSSITTDRDSISQTVRIYDNFYSTTLNVNGAEYDLVFSYFKGTSQNNTIAANFTALLFSIAQQTKIPVQQLLEALQGTNNTLQANNLLCYYLNTFRAKAAMYGTGNIPQPNQAVQRNVVL